MTNIYANRFANVTALIKLAKGVNEAATADLTRANADLCEARDMIQQQIDGILLIKSARLADEVKELREQIKRQPTP